MSYESELDRMIKEGRLRPISEPCKVHVQAPSDWTAQHWLVVRDDGGLFCSTYFATTPEGHDARARAELIAAAVNEYLEKRQ